MKNKILLFFLACSLAALAQPGQSPEPDTTNAVERKPAVVLRDFNYTFLPDGLYQKYSSVKRLDTLTRAFKMVIDTLEDRIQTVVEKSGDQIVIRELANPTAVLYRENVKYVGVTSDGRNTLIYQAQTNDKELIFVNPVLGFVIIAFTTNCILPGRRPGDCDETFHYFGNIERKK